MVFAVMMLTEMYEGYHSEISHLLAPAPPVPGPAAGRISAKSDHVILQHSVFCFRSFLKSSLIDNSKSCHPAATL